MKYTALLAVFAALVAAAPINKGSISTRSVESNTVPSFTSNDVQAPSSLGKIKQNDGFINEFPYAIAPENKMKLDSHDTSEPSAAIPKTDPRPKSDAGIGKDEKQKVKRQHVGECIPGFSWGC